MELTQIPARGYAKATDSSRATTFVIAQMEDLSELNISSNLLTQLNARDRQTLDMIMSANTSPLI